MDESSCRVCVRVRPPSLLQGGDARAVLCNGDGRSLTLPHAGLTFSAVYDDSTCQSTLFEAEASPLVDSAVAGRNGTIIAYGQTGSGKSFTVGEPGAIGSGVREGLLPRIIRHLFSRAAQDQPLGFGYVIHVQVVQVYCERIYDALALDASGTAARREAKSLSLREAKGGDAFVEGAVRRRVESAAQALALLEQAARRVAVCATQMNARSSRSHVVTTLTIERGPMATADGAPPKLPEIARAPLEVPDDARAPGRHSESRGLLERRQSIDAIEGLVSALTQRTTRSRLTVVDLAVRPQCVSWRERVCSSCVPLVFHLCSTCERVRASVLRVLCAASGARAACVAPATLRVSANGSERDRAAVCGCKRIACAPRHRLFGHPRLVSNARRARRTLRGPTCAARGCRKPRRSTRAYSRSHPSSVRSSRTNRRTNKRTNMPTNNR